MPIRGRVRCIDFCIHRIVAALNAAGVHTTFSCCGHQGMPGRIDLDDGRILAIITEKEFHLLWQSGEQCAQPSTLE